MKNQAYFSGERGWGRVIGKQFQMPSTESVQRVVKVTNHQIFSGDNEMRKHFFRGKKKEKNISKCRLLNVYPIC